MTQKRLRSWSLILILLMLTGCGQAAEPFIAWLRTGQEGRAVEEGPVAASGTMQADAVRIASEFGGRLVEVLVGPGDRVQAGQVLARLDSAALESRLAEALAAVAAAEAELSRVKAGPRPAQVAALEAQLALAEAGQEGSRLAWEDALTVLRSPQELAARIAQAETQVRLAEESANLAEAELARQKLIRDQKREGSAERDAAEWQVTAAGSRLAAARAEVEVARVQLAGLTSIRSRPLVLIAQAHAAEGQYRVAEAAVLVAQAQLKDLRAGPTSEEVALAQQALRFQQAQADALRVQRSRFTLTSPLDGVVLEQVLQPGELAAPGATVLIVTDLSRLILEIYVPTGQLGQVQLGQTAQVTVDSYPGRIFQGTVVHVGDQPEYTPRNVVTQEERANVFYVVEIELQNEDQLLKPGMPADAVLDR